VTKICDMLSGCSTTIDPWMSTIQERYVIRSMSIARDSSAGYKTEEELGKARKELHHMKITECLGFPYSIRLAKGYPYMITSNIDVDDGLVNGAIGTLQYIEHLAENNVTEETDTDGYGKITQTVRLWLTFDSKRVGTKARLKA